ncbi:MGMT family protein [Planococcus sp. 107-1]|uniref:MGMT family protein n=1 Tax=Planococcus sp. 107-1 TaxID=2908840 RepID=UPI001F269F90|nr:MGMT family protein [Planococcus sp. 107-1]UJF26001.1 MGMT family protein [Planococcus sp. 107-1]
MQPFTVKAIEIIARIPEGKVMTYGQIAAHAGSPRGARQVARLLHSMSRKHGLPWHRVVNAQGKIVVQDEESRFAQLHSLQEEGVEVAQNGIVDLNQYRYDPSH